MTSTEWPNVDTGMPGSISHDLFGGDLFGDELMDIYNSAAVIEGESTDVAVSSEIPSLGLPSSGQEPEVVSGGETADEHPSHPGAQIALNAAAMDDGLGAFRPSTSFNDLTSLLQPASNEAPSQDPAPAPPSAPTHEVTAPVKVESGKKRSAPQDGPSATKKRATAKSRSNSTSKRSGVTAKSNKTVPTSIAVNKTPSAGQAALKLRQEAASVKNNRGGKDNNTPNPLTGAPAPAVRSMTAAPKPAPVVAAKVAVHLPAPPATVTPRNTASSPKADSITSEAAAATAAAAAVAAAAAASVPAAAPTTTGQTTEADFKSVAQAAVTNLILNAGSNKPDTSTGTGIDEATGFPKKVDTSTAHIKALTSSNWVAACGGGGVSAAADGTSATTAAAAVAADSKANNRARRQNLTPDERARQNRDRNREHARNTRLRKKAYVEELKRTLTELVAQRDAAELEKRHNAQRELEQREVRYRVMEEFLKLRGRNELNFARWIAILEDGFTLTLPGTDFRRSGNDDQPKSGARRVSLPASQVSPEQILNGPSEVMTDSSNVSALLQTLGKGPNAGGVARTPVVMVYHCDRKNFFMDGVNAVLEWSLSSVGAVNQGAPAELNLKGTMHAHFSPASNKLLSAKILFDTGCVKAQLQQLIVPQMLESADLNKGTDTCDAVAAAAAAAQAAANEADALLDSIQMPQLSAAVPSAITVLPSTAVSITSSEKGDSDSDESVDGGMKQEQDNNCNTRRSTRLNEEGIPTQS